MRPFQCGFPAEDGFGLGGTLWATDRMDGGVVIASATGVPRRIYAGLAGFLAEAGLATLTFDYRGIGDSAPLRLRGFPASMENWGRLDVEGALHWMRALRPGLPMLYVGHSVGGQLLGFAPSARTLAGAVFLGAQNGYWRHWRGARRLAILAAYTVLLPGMSRLLGYMPMRRFGQGEHLPAGVALEWARWGRHPEHFLRGRSAEERAGHARLCIPIRAYQFSDDAYAPRVGVERLLQAYAGARKELRTLTPRELGVERIGHFGFSRPAFRGTLWTEMLDWMRRQLPNAPRRAA